LGLIDFVKFEKDRIERSRGVLKNQDYEIKLEAEEDCEEIIWYKKLLSNATHINNSFNQNPNIPGDDDDETKKSECIIVWDFNHSHDNTKVTSIAHKSLETKPS